MNRDIIRAIVKLGNWDKLFALHSESFFVPGDCRKCRRPLADCVWRKRAFEARAQADEDARVEAEEAARLAESGQPS